MKPGDLVRIDGRMINSYTFVIPTLGIYLKDVNWNHPSYSSAFPRCEILTSRGGKHIIGLERIFAL